MKRFYKAGWLTEKEMCVNTEAPAPEKDTEDKVSLLGTSSEND